VPCLSRSTTLLEDVPQLMQGPPMSTDDVEDDLR
jgi:hypothetical protein